MNKFRLVVATLMLFVPAGVTNAAVMTYEVSRTINSDLYFLSFTLDFPVGAVNGSTSGLVVNSINFPVDEGILYSYTASDVLSIGGALPNFSTTGNDFDISINDATSSPTLFAFGLRIPSLGIDTGINADNTTFRFYSGAPAPVPAPPALLMLVTGLIGLGFLRIRRTLQFRKREPDFA